MPEMQLGELTRALRGELIRGDAETVVDAYGIDSRKLPKGGCEPRNASCTLSPRPGSIGESLFCQVRFFGGPRVLSRPFSGLRLRLMVGSATLPPA